ncbi:hypothetical protein H4Q26_006133 [Puccinia striiformis f. sp. tritici PST-130]|nr:hypothetical protein H4Q26_006133 [Puccinia striiformis f. sp. tritici PST-130]
MKLIPKIFAGLLMILNRKVTSLFQLLKPLDHHQKPHRNHPRVPRYCPRLLRARSTDVEAGQNRTLERLHHQIQATPIAVVGSNKCLN